jgi:retron-type reverse transcriptase
VTISHIAQCVGGVLSPLLANIALSVLDEHVMAPWRPDGAMGTTYRRNHGRSKGLPTWRIVRYADLCRRRHKSAYADRRIMPTMAGLAW